MSPLVMKRSSTVAGISRSSPNSPKLNAIRRKFQRKKEAKVSNPHEGYTEPREIYIYIYIYM